MKKIIVLLILLNANHTFAQNYSWQVLDTLEYPFLKSVNTMLLNNSGNAVIYSFNGIAISNGDSLSYFTPYKGSFAGGYDYYYNGTYGAYDSKNNIYYLSLDRYISAQDDSTLKFENNKWSIFYSNPNQDKNYDINYCEDIYCDKVGNVVMNYFQYATQLRKGPRTGTYVFQDGINPVQLPVAFFRTISFDDSNNYWSAAYNGIYKLKGDSAYLYSDSLLGVPPNTACSGYLDHLNRVWIGDHYQLISLENDVATHYPITTVPNDTDISDISFDADNHLYVSSQYGILYFDGIEFKEINDFNSNLPPGEIQQTVIDKFGNIWSWFYDWLARKTSVAECKSCAASITGIGKPVVSGGCDIFPNPATNQINVSTTTFKGNVSVTIFNIYGESVKKKDLQLGNSQRISMDVTELPPGIYELVLAGNLQQSVGKFIKE